MSLLDKEHIIDDEVNRELLIRYLENDGWFRIHKSDVDVEDIFYEKKISSNVVKMRIYYDCYYSRYRYNIEIQNCSLDLIRGLEVYKVNTYRIPVEFEEIWGVLKDLENILQELK